MGVSDRAWRVCVRVKTREEALGCLFLGGSRARGRGSRPRASRPRARLDAYLLLRQAERHQQALPQPHAFVGVGRSAGACAPRARVWAERVRPRCTRERATSRISGAGPGGSREKGGSRRAHSSVRADASGVSASRLAEMGGDHRGGKRHRHGVRGLRLLESAACHAAPRRSRDPALPTCPPIPPGGERASKALDRRLRRSPPRRRADVLVLSLLSLPSSRVDRMAATTAAAAAAGSVPPR